MSFTADFSVSQGIDVSSFTITDTSTGSDPALTGRTVDLYLVDNQLLGGSQILWPLSDGSNKLISGLLIRDFALNIVVNWQSSSPIPGSSYSKARIVEFTGNSNLFAYGLLQQIAANQAMTQDNGFEDNLELVNSDIRNAIRSASYDDQGNSQLALDRIYNKQIKAKFFF